MQAVRLVLAVGFFVSAAFAQGQDRALTIDVPKQPLAGALNTLAEQSEMEIFYLTKDVQSLGTNGINGDFNIEQALDLLLADTTLTYFMDGSRRITVKAVFENAKSEIEEIDMIATSSNRVILATVASTLTGVGADAGAQQEGAAVAQEE